MSVAVRVGRAVRWHVERAIAPLLQVLDARAIASDRMWWRRQADEALAAGIEWFLPQPALTMSALYILWRTWQRGAEPRFSFVTAKIEHYRRTIRDPALRLFDPGYDLDAPEHRGLPDIMDIRPYLPVELLMVEAVWADVHDKGPDFLRQIAAIDDGANYGTTHIVVAAELMKRSGAYPIDSLQALMEPLAEPLAAANRWTTYAGDLFAERIVMLYWMGRGDLVRPEWIAMLLRRQRPDGGWSARGVPPRGQSNQHTTCLSLAAIAEFRTAAAV